LVKCEFVLEVLLTELFITVEKAITGKGTNLSIPVSYTQDAEAVTFVKFRDKKQPTLPQNNDSYLDGLGFEMNLQLTEDAETQIVFDERAGDVIKGRGSGLIRFDVPISGDFKMLGDYKFSEGKYLFTIRQNLINVDKPFNIRRGGTLTWTNGDPFGAQMDITADYKGLRTAPYNLISENILPNSQEEQSAKQSTNVDLMMHMTGALLKPDIAFDVRFPQLAGNLKSYTDNRLNILQQDPAELNRQVFGLIVLGGFLPAGNTLSNNFVGNTVNNTLSGVFSNQASNYINSWLNDVIKDKGVINSVNLDINTQLNVLSSSSTVLVNEVQIKPRFNLFDNRLSLDTGFVGGEDQNAQTYISNDFAVEYIITEDRHIRVRAYNRAIQEIDGQRKRTGVGLTWRKEFDKWSDLRKKKL
jgi:TamB, inner membrane protein subunit of TAM complex